MTKKILWLCFIVGSGSAAAMTAFHDCHVQLVPCMSTIEGGYEYCEEEKCEVYPVWYPYRREDRAW